MHTQALQAQYRVLQIFSVTFPFFALVLCGYVAARRGMLPLEAIAGLNGFVLFFSLPCMLYRFGATTPIAQLLDVGVLLTWLICALIMVGFTVTVSLNRRIRWNDASFGALVAAFPNTGFMGVPLLVTLIGAHAAGPMIVTIVVDMLVTTSLCIALSRLDGASAQGVALATKNALKGIFLNPMPWAILLGGVASLLQFELPAPLTKTVWLLADAASPTALFTIGTVMARSQMLARQRQQGQPPLRDYIPVAMFKLLLHPALVLLIGISAMQLGLALDQSSLVVMVLVAALPSASNVSMLAERYGADNGRIARIILVSTAASFLSFSGAVALLTGN